MLSELAGLEPDIYEWKLEKGAWILGNGFWWIKIEPEILQRNSFHDRRIIRGYRAYINKNISDPTTWKQAHFFRKLIDAQEWGAKIIRDCSA